MTELIEIRRVSRHGVLVYGRSTTSTLRSHPCSAAHVEVLVTPEDLDTVEIRWQGCHICTAVAAHRAAQILPPDNAEAES